MSSPGAPVPGGPDRPPDGDPPAAAEVLEYRADLAVVRGFAASWGRRAGLTPERVDDLVMVVGELTANTLEDKKPDRLIFDMAAVGFLDCSAAGVMLAAARSMLPGRKPVIRAPGRLVRTLLELTGLDTQCELAD